MIEKFDSPTHARGFLFGAATLVLMLAAPASAYDPFDLPEAQLRAEVKTVAVAPLRLSYSGPRRTAVKQAIEAAIEEDLRQGGFTVIAAAQTQKVWRPLAESLGNLYDPVTGEADVTKLEALYQHTGAELARLYQVDAVVWPNINYDMVVAEVSPFTSRVSALGEPIIWKGQPLSMGHWMRRPQRIVASWFGLTLRDLGGTSLYNINVPIAWLEVYVDRSHGKRPDGEFENDLLIRKAVDAALNRLVHPCAGATSP